MSDHDAGAHSSIDALLPPKMAERAEQIGMRKASMSAIPLFALAVLAGGFIALGGVFATVVLSGAGSAPWGLVRLAAGIAFSLGLILVVVGGAELFTGNTLIVMAWAGGKVGTRLMLHNWMVVYAGNFVGALGIAALVFLGGTYHSGGGAFGVSALTIANAKLGYGFVQAFALGVLCNVLVCLAVWLTFSARTTTDRILAVIPPVAAFVAAGFEHSIANMYFVSLALFVAWWDPGFAAARGIDVHALDGTTFLVRNLLPVTLGNIAGGTLLVGAVYWFVYLRPRGHASGA